VAMMSRRVTSIESRSDSTISRPHMHEPTRVVVLPFTWIVFMFVFTPSQIGAFQFHLLPRPSYVHTCRGVRTSGDEQGCEREWVQ